jgi:hypothetical protein
MSYQADHIKRDEMGGTGSTHIGDKKCLQKFARKHYRKRILETQV